MRNASMHSQAFGAIIIACGDGRPLEMQNFSRLLCARMEFLDRQLNILCYICSMFGLIQKIAFKQKNESSEQHKKARRVERKSPT